MDDLQDIDDIGTRLEKDEEKMVLSTMFSGAGASSRTASHNGASSPTASHHGASSRTASRMPGRRLPSNRELKVRKTREAAIIHAVEEEKQAVKDTKQREHERQTEEARRQQHWWSMRVEPEAPASDRDNLSPLDCQETIAVVEEDAQLQMQTEDEMLKEMRWQTASRLQQIWRMRRIRRARKELARLKADTAGKRKLETMREGTVRMLAIKIHRAHHLGGAKRVFCRLRLVAAHATTSQKVEVTKVAKRKAAKQFILESAITLRLTMLAKVKGWDTHREDAAATRIQRKWRLRIQRLRALNKAKATQIKWHFSFSDEDGVELRVTDINSTLVVEIYDADIDEKIEDEIDLECSSSGVLGMLSPKQTAAQELQQRLEKQAKIKQKRQKKTQIGFVLVPLSRLALDYLVDGKDGDHVGGGLRRAFRVFPPQTITEQLEAQLALQQGAVAGGKLLHNGISQPSWAIGAMELQLSLRAHTPTYGMGIFGPCGYVNTYLHPPRVDNLYLHEAGTVVGIHAGGDVALPGGSGYGSGVWHRDGWRIIDALGPLTATIARLNDSWMRLFILLAPPLWLTSFFAMLNCTPRAEDLTLDGK
jgi:hypothetical protein